MAPPRKPAEPGRTHPVHLRLPTDVFERIEARARREGRPFNRIAIDDLARLPYLDRQAELAEQIGDMKVTLAKYSARVAQTEVNEDLLRALDAALAAPTAAQREPLFDGLRVVRARMLEIERQTAKIERDQLTAQIKLLDREIKAIEALPDSSLDKDDLPGLKDELARLQQAAAVGAPGE